MKIITKIDGLAALDQALAQLPQKIRGRPLRAAVSAGARVVQKEARARVPVETGLVRDRIRVMGMKQAQSNARAESVVGVRRSSKSKKTKDKATDPFYWRFIEFGTKFKPARSFLRAAFEAKRDEAVAVIKERLAKRIEVEAEKLRRR